MSAGEPSTKQQIFQEMVNSGAFFKIQSGFMADLTDAVAQSDIDECKSYKKPGNSLASEMASDLIIKFLQDHDMNDSLRAAQSESQNDLRNRHSQDFIGKNLQLNPKKPLIKQLCNDRAEEGTVASTMPSEVTQIIEDILGQSNMLQRPPSDSDEDMDGEDETLETTLDRFAQTPRQKKALEERMLREMERMEKEKQKRIEKERKEAEKAERRRIREERRLERARAREPVLTITEEIIEEEEDTEDYSDEPPQHGEYVNAEIMHGKSQLNRKPKTEKGEKTAPSTIYIEEEEEVYEEEDVFETSTSGIDSSDLIRTGDTFYSIEENYPEPTSRHTLNMNPTLTSTVTTGSGSYRSSMTGSSNSNSSEQPNGSAYPGSSTTTNNNSSHITETRTRSSATNGSSSRSSSRSTGASMGNDLGTNDPTLESQYPGSYSASTGESSPYSQSSYSQGDSAYPASQSRSTPGASQTTQSTHPRSSASGSRTSTGSGSSTRQGPSMGMPTLDSDYPGSSDPLYRGPPQRSSDNSNTYSTSGGSYSKYSAYAYSQSQSGKGDTIDSMLESQYPGEYTPSYSYSNSGETPSGSYNGSVSGSGSSQSKSSQDKSRSKSSDIDEMLESTYPGQYSTSEESAPVDPLVASGALISSYSRPNDESIQDKQPLLSGDLESGFSGQYSATYSENISAESQSQSGTKSASQRSQSGTYSRSNEDSGEYDDTDFTYETVTVDENGNIIGEVNGTLVTTVTGTGTNSGTYSYSKSGSHRSRSDTNSQSGSDNPHYVGTSELTELPSHTPTGSTYLTTQYTNPSQSSSASQSMTSQSTHGSSDQYTDETDFTYETVTIDENGVPLHPLSNVIVSTDAPSSTQSQSKTATSLADAIRRPQAGGQQLMDSLDTYDQDSGEFTYETVSIDESGRIVSAAGTDEEGRPILTGPRAPVTGSQELDSIHTYSDTYSEQVQTHITNPNSGTNRQPSIVTPDSRGISMGTVGTAPSQSYDDDEEFTYETVTVDDQGIPINSTYSTQPVAPSLVASIPGGPTITPEGLILPPQNRMVSSSGVESTVSSAADSGSSNSRFKSGNTYDSEEIESTDTDEHSLGHGFVALPRKSRKPTGATGSTLASAVSKRSAEELVREEEARRSMESLENNNDEEEDYTYATVTVDEDGLPVVPPSGDEYSFKKELQQIQRDKRPEEAKPIGEAPIWAQELVDENQSPEEEEYTYATVTVDETTGKPVDPSLLEYSTKSNEPGPDTYSINSYTSIKQKPMSNAPSNKHQSSIASSRFNTSEESTGRSKSRSRTGSSQSPKLRVPSTKTLQEMDEDSDDYSSDDMTYATVTVDEYGIPVDKEIQEAVSKSSTSGGQRPIETEDVNSTFSSTSEGNSNLPPPPASGSESRKSSFRQQTRDSRDSLTTASYSRPLTKLEEAIALSRKNTIDSESETYTDTETASGTYDDEYTYATVTVDEKGVPVNTTIRQKPKRIEPKKEEDEEPPSLWSELTKPKSEESAKSRAERIAEMAGANQRNKLRDPKHPQRWEDMVKGDDIPTSEPTIDDSATTSDYTYASVSVDSYNNPLIGGDTKKTTSNGKEKEPERSAKEKSKQRQSRSRTETISTTASKFQANSDTIDSDSTIESTMDTDERSFSRPISRPSTSLAQAIGKDNDTSRLPAPPPEIRGDMVSTLESSTESESTYDEDTSRKASVRQKIIPSKFSKSESGEGYSEDSGENDKPSRKGAVLPPFVASNAATKGSRRDPTVESTIDIPNDSETFTYASVSMAEEEYQKLANPKNRNLIPPSPPKQTTWEDMVNHPIRDVPSEETNDRIDTLETETPTEELNDWERMVRGKSSTATRLNERPATTNDISETELSSESTTHDVYTYRTVTITPDIEKALSQTIPHKKSSAKQDQESDEELNTWDRLKNMGDEEPHDETPSYGEIDFKDVKLPSRGGKFTDPKKRTRTHSRSQEDENDTYDYTYVSASIDENDDIFRHMMRKANPADQSAQRGDNAVLITPDSIALKTPTNTESYSYTDAQSTGRNKSRPSKHNFQRGADDTLSSDIDTDTRTHSRKGPSLAGALRAGEGQEPTLESADFSTGDSYDAVIDIASDGMMVHKKPGEDSESEKQLPAYKPEDLYGKPGIHKPSKYGKYGKQAEEVEKNEPSAWEKMMANKFEPEPLYSSEQSQESEGVEKRIPKMKSKAPSPEDEYSEDESNTYTYESVTADSELLSRLTGKGRRPVNGDLQSDETYTYDEITASESDIMQQPSKKRQRQPPSKQAPTGQTNREIHQLKNAPSFTSPNSSFNRAPPLKNEYGDYTYSYTAPFTDTEVDQESDALLSKEARKAPPPQRHRANNLLAAIGKMKEGAESDAFTDESEAIESGTGEYKPAFRRPTQKDRLMDSEALSDHPVNDEPTYSGEYSSNFTYTYDEYTADEQTSTQQREKPASQSRSRFQEASKKTQPSFTSPEPTQGIDTQDYSTISEKPQRRKQPQRQRQSNISDGYESGDYGSYSTYDDSAANRFFEKMFNEPKQEPEPYKPLERTNNAPNNALAEAIKKDAVEQQLNEKPSAIAIPKGQQSDFSYTNDSEPTYDSGYYSESTQEPRKQVAIARKQSQPKKPLSPRSAQKLPSPKEAGLQPPSQFRSRFEAGPTQTTGIDTEDYSSATESAAEGYKTIASRKAERKQARQRNRGSAQQQKEPFQDPWKQPYQPQKPQQQKQQPQHQEQEMPSLPAPTSSQVYSEEAYGSQMSEYTADESTFYDSIASDEVREAETGHVTPLPTLEQTTPKQSMPQTATSRRQRQPPTRVRGPAPERASLPKRPPTIENDFDSTVSASFYEQDEKEKEAAKQKEEQEKMEKEQKEREEEAPKSEEREPQERKRPTRDRSRGRENGGHRASGRGRSPMSTLDEPYIPMPIPNREDVFPERAAPPLPSKFADAGTGSTVSTIDTPASTDYTKSMSGPPSVDNESEKESQKESQKEESQKEELDDDVPDVVTGTYTYTYEDESDISIKPKIVPRPIKPERPQYIYHIPDQPPINQREPEKPVSKFAAIPQGSTSYSRIESSLASINSLCNLVEPNAMQLRKPSRELVDPTEPIPISRGIPSDMTYTYTYETAPSEQSTAAKTAEKGRRQRGRKDNTGDSGTW